MSKNATQIRIVNKLKQTWVLAMLGKRVVTRINGQRVLMERTENGVYFSNWQIGTYDADRFGNAVLGK